MRYELYVTPIFERKLNSFLKKHPEMENEIEKILDILVKNPFTPVLKTHKLSSKLKNQYAVCLSYEYRLLFVLEEGKIYLTNIGTHDEVY